MQGVRAWVLGVSLVAVICLAAACGGGATVTPASAGTLPTAQAALDAGDLAAAEQGFRAAVAGDPKSAQAQFGLGNVLVRQGKLADAATAYTAALALDPKLAAAHANLGVVYYQQGQLAQAAASFKAALAITPDDAQTTYLLAAVRIQENNLAEAETLLVKARALDPDLPEVYYGLGVLYKLKGQKADAIAAFEKFLQIGPGQDPQAMDYARNELNALKGQ